MRWLSKKSMWLGLICTALGMAAGGPLPFLSRANAHPHVFIVQRLNLVFHENWLAGIKVRWKMDDMFASMIAEDHDKKRNGTLEADEVKSVKENAFFYPGVEFFVKIIVWQHQLKQSMSGIVSVLGLRYVIERSG